MLLHKRKPKWNMQAKWHLMRNRIQATPPFQMAMTVKAQYANTNTQQLITKIENQTKISKEQNKTKTELCPKHTISEVPMMCVVQLIFS